MNQTNILNPLILMILYSSVAAATRLLRVDSPLNFSFKLHIPHLNSAKSIEVTSPVGLWLKLEFMVI